MAIFGFRPRFDRLAKGNARWQQLNLHLVPAPQTIGEHAQMQFALGGNNRLVQLRVHVVEQGRILFVQCRQSRGDLVFLAF